MKRQFLMAFLALTLATGVLAEEPNDTFSTATVIPRGHYDVFDALSNGVINRPDTLLGIRDSSRSVYLIDDDGSPIGNGTASGIRHVATHSGSIDFLVTGVGDDAFGGLHQQAGDYEVFVDVYGPAGDPVDAFSEPRTLQPGAVHEFSFSDFDWTDCTYDVYIDNTVGQVIPADVDFFMFTGLPQGASFAARTAGVDAAGIDTFLGWFDDAGALLRTDDDGGVGPLSLITDSVPPSGTLIFAVTGKGDNEFVGNHVMNGAYQLVLTLDQVGVLSDYNDNGIVDAADVVLWRHTLGAAGVGLAADGNRDNRITAADYEIWRSHFGEHLVGVPSFVGVPEPASSEMAVLLATALLICPVGITRQRHRSGLTHSSPPGPPSDQCRDLPHCGPNGANSGSAKCGLTLVELLAVIAICGVLFALLLPAIQALRESARRARCESNLKQLGLALLTYHDIHRSFPHGGWGHLWVGVPDRGTGQRQPGGWIYCLLPHLEALDLHHLGESLSGPAADEAYTRRLRTPLPMLVCPTRRSCSAWPVAEPYPYVRTPKPFGTVSLVARADYAINGGASHVLSHDGPTSFQQGDDAEYWHKAPSVRQFTGISHLRTAVSLNSVLDGASATYLIGEKHLSSEEYETGTSLGDNESLYAGYCTDLHRFTGALERMAVALPPYGVPLADTQQATVGLAATARFGSAHPTGLNVIRCDGSGHFVRYDIDADVYFRSGHRADEGKPLKSLR